jgi:hypothetical protein
MKKRITRTYEHFADLRDTARLIEEDLGINFDEAYKMAIQAERNYIMIKEIKEFKKIFISAFVVSGADRHPSALGVERD